MFGRKRKKLGDLDRGDDRAAPVSGERLPDGDRALDDGGGRDVEDRDFGWEEGDPADRRRDPLRKP